MKNFRYVYYFFFLLLLFSSLVSAQTARDLNKRAIAEYNNGNMEKAVEYGEKAVQTYKANNSSAPNLYVSLLNNLTIFYMEVSRYKDARVVGLKSLAFTEEHFDSAHKSYGHTMGTLSGLFRKLEMHDKAEDCYLSAINNARINEGDSSRIYLTRINNYGMYQTQRGNLKKAEMYLLEAVSVGKKVLGTNNNHYISYLANLADLKSDLGKLSESIKLYKEAVALSEKVVGINHPSYALRVANLATIYMDRGEYENSLPLFLEAIAITDSNLGINHPNYATFLNNLGRLYSEMSYYGKALEYYREALNVKEQKLGTNNATYLLTLNNIASFYQMSGNLLKAIRLQKKIVKEALPLLGETHPDYLIYLNNLAILYKDVYDYKKAEKIFLKLIEAYESKYGSETPTILDFKSNLATLYRSMDRNNKSLELNLEVLKTTEQVLGKNHPDYCLAMNNIAVVYDVLNMEKEAGKYYHDGLNLTRKLLGDAAPEYSLAVNNVGAFYADRQRYEEALPYYLAADSSLHMQIKSAFSFLSESESKAFLNDLKFNFTIYQSFNVLTEGKFKQMNKLVYNNQLKLKGLLLKNAKILRRAVQNSPDSTTLDLFNKWLRAKKILAKQYTLPENERGESVKSLQNLTDEVENKLKTRSAEFKHAANRGNISWKDVRDNLKAGEAAIEFASFKYYTHKPTDSTLIAAYILKNNSTQPEQTVLCTEAEIKALAKKSAKGELYKSRGLKIKKATPLNLGEKLYSLIIKPLESSLKDIHTIYFACDGILHQLAFAAIPVDEKTLLSEKYNLIRLNTTAAVAKEKTIPEFGSALFTGGIDFEYSPKSETTPHKHENSIQFNIKADSSLRSNNRSLGWVFLPGTLEEINALAKLFKKKSAETKFLTGKEASEEKVKSYDGRSPKVLHFATHGYFFENPGTRETDAGTRSVYSNSKDPLFRSGLIFAGGNFAWKNGKNEYEKEDGILTAYEISNLDLSNTDVVVLSACETGLGDIDGSEGVYGLQRAFRMAGVDNIIMSLWEVPDDETAEFMEYFYSEWLTGKTLRAAFDSAQKKMIKKYRNEPEKWAAFILAE